ncbi:MAG: hypothetical protein OJF52_003493 [Nitrospira sp.]|jgi:excisionase family DNA binding protein|nr:MAG: hypothetical protein OJF52_003493 [Nitrospira sp.]
MREIQAAIVQPDNPVALEVMTPEEAAVFLRVSRSTIYQRPDIPRHRLPGSRQIRFLRSELLAWLKGEFVGEHEAESAGDGKRPLLTLAAAQKPVYHRSARYR